MLTSTPDSMSKIEAKGSLCSSYGLAERWQDRFNPLPRSAVLKIKFVLIFPDGEF